jgi:hypothetical protein
MEIKLAHWFIFSVLIALVPILANAITLKIHDSYSSLESVISRGQLLLITSGLCAASAGTLIGTDNKLIIWKIVAGGTAFFIFSISTFVYAQVNSSIQTGTNINQGLIVKFSISLFVSALISCAACIILAEYK